MCSKYVKGPSLKTCKAINDHEHAKERRLTNRDPAGPCYPVVTIIQPVYFQEELAEHVFLTEQIAVSQKSTVESGVNESAYVM